MEKSQNKVTVAEEIGSGNDLVFSKIGRENENEKSLVLGGWMDGWVGVRPVTHYMFLHGFSGFGVIYLLLTLVVKNLSNKK